MGQFLSSIQCTYMPVSILSTYLRATDMMERRLYAAGKINTRKTYPMDIFSI